MKLRLQITTSPGASFAFEHSGPLLRIGRDPEGELALQGEASDSVSWNHARIDLTSLAAYLIDLQSTNGTFVNGRRIVEREPLRIGDQVQLGHTGPMLKVVELDLSVLTIQPPGQPAVPANAPSAEAASTSPGEVLAAVQRTQRNTLVGIGVIGVGLLLLVVGIWWKQRNSGAQYAEKAPPQPAGSGPNHQEPPLPRPSIIAPKAPVTPAKIQETNLPSEKSRTVGRYVSADKEPPNILLQRQRDPEPWGRLRPGDPVQTAFYLVSLPGCRSKMYLENGVRVVLWGNVPEFSNFPPMLESTVVLHDPAKGIDLDFTLDRGRVYLASYKEKGAAQVRVRFHREIWDLTLPDPQTEIVLELWGLYDPPPVAQAQGKGPLACLGLFAKGTAQLKIGERQYHLSDLSQFTWTSNGQAPVGPERLKELPPWWTNKLHPQSGQQADVMAAIKDLSDKVGDKPGQTNSVLDAVLTQVRESEFPANRSYGALCLGALDALPALVDALDRQHSEVRLGAAFALRQWASRSGEYDQELYRTLHEKKGYAKEKAELIVRLLHTFSAEDLADAKTYETLIAHLNHENLVIRELAYWHLSLLVPEGAKTIAYDPAASPEERQQAFERWKKLVPDGKLPPRPAPRQK